MRINFFRERLLKGVSFSFTQLPDFNRSTSTPVKAETETTPKKFGTKELVENLGISEAQAKLLISGAKGDANAQVTEQELFEEIQKGKVFNTGVRDGERGDVFDSANYNNKALLDRLDKLDGKTNIEFNKETKNIAWEAAGAEEPVSLDFVELNQDILVDQENQISEALTLGTEAGRLSAATLRNEIDITKELLGISREGEEFMAGLSDKVQIDFGDMSEEEALNNYKVNLANYASLEDQQAEALSLNSEAGRISSAALRTEIALTGHVLKELERQYGFNDEDFKEELSGRADSMLSTETQNLTNLQAQMAEALAIDTEAGRVSAAALRVEIANTQKLITHWEKSAEFWGE